MQALNKLKSDLLTVHQDKATIIRITKLTETSLIVTWISENHGLLKTVAKGARRIKSPFRGKLDLFYSADVCWSKGRSADLRTATEVSPYNYREKLRKSYPNIEMAAYFCNLLENLIEPESEDEGFFDLLNRGLDYLCDHKISEKAMVHFERESTKLLGIYTEKKRPHLLLEEIVGKLPKSRGRCVDLLQDISS